MSHTLHITSFSNPKFKWLKSFAKSRNRKSEGLFLMEGRPELDHSIKQGRTVQMAVFCDSYTSESEVAALVGEVSLLKLDKALFDDLAYQHVPGNFILVAESWECKLSELDPKKNTVVLERIEKPGNLGAILRTCDAAGIDQVIVSDSEIDLFNPNVLRNSRGGVFGVDCVFTSNEETLAWLKDNQIQVCSAALREDAVQLSNLSDSGVKAFVFGAESKGLTDFWIDNADQVFMLPMKGIVDSLNLSVTVGIVLFSGPWK